MEGTTEKMQGDDNIKTCFEEMGWEGVERIHLAQGWDQSGSILKKMRGIS